MVGDPSFADIRFIAEGKSIFAHRFIVEKRCDYFRIMLNSGMKESFSYSKRENLYTQNNGNGPKFVDIVVPGEFLLCFSSFVITSL